MEWRKEIVELYELTAHELGRLIKERKASSVEITKSFIDRIKKVDGIIGSYITVCEEEALKSA